VLSRGAAVGFLLQAPIELQDDPVRILEETG